MQTNKSKNQIAPLPSQVEAVNQFHQVIESYFDINNLKGINGVLIELVSAVTGPDPRVGKHAPIHIAGTLTDVRNTINLISKAKVLVNEPSFKDYTQNLAYNLQAVGSFDTDRLSDLLYTALDCYIFQEDNFEGATLQFASEITATFKFIYDWLVECDAWLKVSTVNESLNQELVISG